MYEGWLWLSILKIAASPSPISTTPAFSPGPQITCGPVVGSFFKCSRDDLYEQCSDHITEKMPSSVRLGSRPIAREHALIFFRGQAVFGDDLGGDGRFGHGARLATQFAIV